ncbi:hypothetical protein GH714_036348 [Hevea brasiliensis]|uniref:PB1-like domain-containing protein n=1 Tax=Hevea brasiliensis TaxID=3981 RepID=A0A6A6M6F8_HEVBR|nr:hypothetical protein GH714_036348 [Hevea brasiliensis]
MERVKSTMVYVSLLIHHGKVLLDGNDSFEHMGGEIFYWEDRDVDLMSYIDIDNELKKLGYGEITKMAYLIPRKPKGDGISGSIKGARNYNDNSVEEVRVGDEQSNEDGNYVLIDDEGESGDYEIENEAFVNYHTSNSEWDTVRQVLKKK